MEPIRGELREVVGRGGSRVSQHVIPRATIDSLWIWPEFNWSEQYRPDNECNLSPTGITVLDQIAEQPHGRFSMSRRLLDLSEGREFSQSSLGPLRGRLAPIEGQCRIHKYE